jgi:hypothetical protein
MSWRRGETNGVRAGGRVGIASVAGEKGLHCPRFMPPGHVFITCAVHAKLVAADAYATVFLRIESASS